MSYRELMDWADYYALEPWGDRRADLRNAILCSLLANVNRDSKARPEPFTVKDFMPFEDEHEWKEQTKEQDASQGATIDSSALTMLFTSAVTKPKKAT